MGKERLHLIGGDVETCFYNTFIGAFLDRFDEIDTGVSGSIAEKMALIMQEMGKQNRQVISITHLPQIAARGITHYKVYKEDTETGTNSHIRRLTDEERVKEIANMLSGATLTEAALNNAKALISG